MRLLKWSWGWKMKLKMGVVYWAFTVCIYNILIDFGFFFFNYFMSKTKGAAGQECFFLEM